MIDWNACIKPLVSGPGTPTTSSHSEEDLKAIVDAINVNAKQILEHDSMHECFFSSFVALVGHFLTKSLDNVPKHLFHDFVSACEVLLKFCLSRLLTFDVQCAVPQKNLMQLITALCLGNITFVRGDVITFTAMLKSATLPMSVKKMDADASGSTERPAEAPSSKQLMDQMSMTFQLYSAGIKIAGESSTVGKEVLKRENIATLSRLTSSQSLDQIYQNLAYLKRYINRVADLRQDKPIVLPDSPSAALTVRNGLGPLSSNVSIILQLVSLPLLESLKGERIENLYKLGLSCLYAAVSVTSSMSLLRNTDKSVVASASGTAAGKIAKEPDFESIADNVVYEAIEIYRGVERTFSTNLCAPQVLSNFRMAAAYILSQGVAGISEQFPHDHGKGTESQQTSKGYLTPLTQALTLVLIKALEFLLDDLSLESSVGEDAPPTSNVFDVFALNTPLVRFQAVTAKCDLLKLLVGFVHHSFDTTVKGSASGDVQTDATQDRAKSPRNTARDDSGASDDEMFNENTFDMDSASSIPMFRLDSVDSDDNDFSSSDEEGGNGSFGFSGGPLLGEWFLRLLDAELGNEEETEGLPPFVSISVSSEAGRKFLLPDEAIIRKESQKTCPLPDTDPSAFSAKILDLINRKLVASKSDTISGYVRENLSETLVSKLAGLVKEAGASCTDCFFLMRLMHTLLSSGLLNKSKLTAVLEANNMNSPEKQLFANSKSLSLLFKILFQGQVEARAEDRDHGAAVAFMHALVTHFRDIKILEDVEFRDVQVEVVQMCLFLFHTVSDKAKQEFFAAVFDSLSTRRDEENIPVASARLSVLLEYMLYHYSRPSRSLFSHTQWNLVTVHLEDQSGEERTTKRFKRFGVGISDSGTGTVKGSSFFTVLPMADDKSREKASNGRKTVEADLPNSELFYELSDASLPKEELGLDLAMDAAVDDVLKECGISKKQLYNTVTSALGSGSKLPASKATHKESTCTIMESYLLAKHFFNYNFRVAWRLFKALTPGKDIEADLEETADDSPAQLLASAFLLQSGYNTSSSSSEDIEKLMSLVCRYLEKNFLPKNETETDILEIASLPPPALIMMLDCLLSQLYCRKSIAEELKEEDAAEKPLAEDQFKLLFDSLTYLAKVCRSHVLHNSGVSDADFRPLDRLMKCDVSGIKLSKNPEASILFPALPPSLQKEVNNWDARARDKAIGSEPECEKTDTIIHHYLKALTGEEPYRVCLQYLAVSMCRVIPELSTLLTSPSKGLASSAASLIPLHVDALMMKFCAGSTVDLKDCVPFHDTLSCYVVHQMYEFIVNTELKSELEGREYSTAYLKFLEKMLSEPDASSIRRAMYQFFVGAKETKQELAKVDPKTAVSKPEYKGIDLGCSGEFVILLLSCRTEVTDEFAYALFNLVCKMFEGAVGPNVDPNLVAVVSKMDQLLNVPFIDLYEWLNTFTLSILMNYPASDHMRRSGVPLRLVHYLTHADAPVDHGLALTILQSSLTFPERHLKTFAMNDFLTILMTLAEAKQGQGHFKLFQAAHTWLKSCSDELSGLKDFASPTEESVNLVNVCELILFYLTDVLFAVHGVKSEELYDGDAPNEFEDDLMAHDEEIAEEAESTENVPPAVEYDKDEEDLCNKLCTYTITQKEFMNQHWYHCHTCDMTEGIGVCTICAKVCHKGHDLAYAKYGSFFCDCGAKGSKACRALTKRDPVIESATASSTSASSSNTTVIPSASSSLSSMRSKKVFSEPPAVIPAASALSLASARSGEQQRARRAKLCRNVEGCREDLLHYLGAEGGKDKTVSLLLSVVSDLEKVVSSEQYRSATIRSTAHAIQTMKKLHTCEKKTELVETLMVPTLGSQEGAFENVKANFTGEQGQTIRQLINTRMISRVAMCCLSSGSGKRHHMAVSHEKSKLTILQLSALLKQADASKRKLTLTRLSTTQIPFTIVTLANNPCNEEVLAVCGLKDCHVLTFTSSGIVNEHLILHPQLTAGNYIIKALWLPGSQSKIALVTAKFVKIYDLSVDVLSPAFYFLLPTGKIRDATFVVASTGEDVLPCLVVMSSSGYMYTQHLCEESSATHGPFYVTNALSVVDDSLKEKNDQVGGGGVSVYYSHSLQLLFFSYGNGKNFAATLDLVLEKANKLFPITYKPLNGKNNGNGSLALFSWNEVVGHSGLLTCFTHNNTTPVAVMVDPEKISLQEIKVTTNSKAKIQDIVAVRHSSPGDVEKSTVIALCEDGSLRIYLANPETTGFWLSPSLQPKSVFGRMHGRGRSSQKSFSSESVKAKEHEQVEAVFPVDFFEHCQAISSSDLEFGGEALLRVYNPSQIKNRLNNQGMYIVSKKSFPIEVTIKNKNMIVTGVRIQVGNRGSDSAPTHVYIGDRYISLGPRLKKPRWFDFPLTREESIQYRSKFVITCGCSVHPDDYNIVDSVKLYGKTKEGFGWQEEEAKASALSAKAPLKAKVGSGEKSRGKLENGETDVAARSPSPASAFDGSYLTPADRLLHACLLSLNCCYSSSKEGLAEGMRDQALKLAGNLMVQPVPRAIHRQVKRLTANILGSQDDYHKFKDGTMLEHASKLLAKDKETPDKADDGNKTDSTEGVVMNYLCADEYQILLMELRRIASRRPLNMVDATCVQTETSQGSEGTCVVGEIPSSTSVRYSTQLQDMLRILLRLIKEKPAHKLLAPSCLPGIQHIEASVQAFVDIIHSVAMTIPDIVDKAAEIYYDLLTDEHVQVSSAARSALIRLLYRHSPHPSKSRPTRSNSKSTDTAPSTRSNSPPSVMSNQAVATAPSDGVLVITSSQSAQGFQHPAAYIGAHDAVRESVNDDLEDDENEEDSEADEFDDDDGQLDEDILMEEERENGIAPSLDRDEQLMAMQALEENMGQGHQESSSQQNNQEDGAASGVQGNENGAQNQVQRLRDLMRDPENQNFFMQEDSLEEMIMDVHDDEFASFEGDDEAMVEFAIALSLQQSGGQPPEQQPAAAAPSEIASEVMNEIVRSMTSRDDQDEEDHHAVTFEAQHSVEEAPAAVMTSQSNGMTNDVTQNMKADEGNEDTKPSDWPSSAAGTSGAQNSSTESSRYMECVFDKEKMENMRIQLLQKLLKRLPEILKLEKGERSIPYFQVLIMLTKCLTPHKEAHRVRIEEVINDLARNLDGKTHGDALANISERSAVNEMLANIIRCLVILMSTHETAEAASERTDTGDGVAHEDTEPTSMNGLTAKILMEHGVIEQCFVLLDRMLEQHWNISLEKNKAAPAGVTKLLKVTSNLPAPDYTPIVLPQYVRAHAGDIFEAYPEVITEQLLHLPYRFKKYFDSQKKPVPESLTSHYVTLPPTGDTFCWILSSYMLSTDIPVIKKRVRKALLYLCGSKENYREIRDIHALDSYIENICEVWETVDASSRMGNANFPYDKLILIIHYLEGCSVIATKRTANWQKFCHSVLKNCMGLLLELSTYVSENVATTVLQLLICAVSVGKKKDKETGGKSSKTALKESKPSTSKATPSSSATQQQDKKAPSGDTEMGTELSRRFLSKVEEKDLLVFLQRFLLEINTTSVRWSAHEFVLQLFKNTDGALRSKLVNSMWMLWPSVPAFGRKSIQFVDLLGYLSIENGLDPEKSQLFTDAAFGMLRKQNVLLTNHPNSMLYMQLSNYVDFDGYFLESNPCLVCNQPEVPFSTLKLSSIKADTKYTTTQQIIKLVGSYSLQKVTIKITDIKQTKMIRTVSLFYNNKKVPAIIELKNKPELWHKAKQLTLSQGQNEVKFDLPLPVVATNLMLEFSDFYENISATTETLQCPRCSASVQANPGICGNCGENVFQCHKCRSINYDEKDPFLCNVCGFSKHAKFDITLLAKPCCAVDTIENEEDRKKTVSVVSVLLEKADLAYYQMLSYKPDLEHMLLQIEKLTTESAPSSPKAFAPPPGGTTTAANNSVTTRVPILSANQPIGLGGGPNIAGPSSGLSVNIHIRHIAQKYCVEAKNSFDELSKIMKTVLASRKEIVEYDRRQRAAMSSGREQADKQAHVTSATSAGQSAKNCYGCAAATAKQCIVLLRALATDKTSRKQLVSNGLIAELVHVSLRRGNTATRKQVQQLIGQLVRNDHGASAQLNNLLFNRIMSAMLHHNQDLYPASVSSEMNLLTSILGIQDDCWQLRVRTVFQLFQLSLNMQSPAIIENITLPCMKMLKAQAAPVISETIASPLIQAAKHSQEVTVDAQAWLASDPEQDFGQWKENKIRSNVVASEFSKESKTDVREAFLREKYARKWRGYVAARKRKKKEFPNKRTNLPNQKWLRTMLFCKSSRAVRQEACMIVKSMSENSARKAQVIDLLTSYLDELSSAGEAGAEFFSLYQKQIRDPQWKVYLAAKDILPFIGNLIEREISNLLKLEDSTLMLDLQQGYSLKELTELLSELVHVPYIQQHYKSSLVGTVLNSYLSLRKLVIQRTNIIDDTQDILLELLEDMTTGTESETKAFMAVCIETINKYELSDIRTPQFIFERLANIIFPEENNTSEFFLSLDKDPLQEDFLQGRMVGNPYSSTEPGLGPLMRDVKNKICRDCDLVALLEDDNGMELLVNNKIISLDLPVRDVYNKVWLPSHGDDEAMRVVYRMRGLLGEATEDIVDKVDSEVDSRDEEEVYKMSSVLSQCGGIEAMLQRLDSVENLSHGRQLVDAIMKLMTYIVRLKSNRQYLMKPELNTLNVLLGTLNLGLQSGEDGVPLVEQLLQVMDRVLQETGDDKTQVYTGDKEKLSLLLQQIDSELVRHHSKVLRGLMRIIPFLSFGDQDLMQMLVDHFKFALDFEKFDESHTEEDAVYLDCFCEISTGIEDNENGYQLKNLIIKNEIVHKALAYISRYVPQHKKFESEDWKQFVSRQALPYCLRLLAGLSARHAPTQTLIGETSIPDLHRLEQVSTQGSIGSLAENVLEAISAHPDVAKTIKEVRRETRAEKKRLAMAVRQKELGALGMKANAKGQVVTQTPLLKQIGDLVEESGLTCIICREGYKFEPKKVLGIYTYSKRCALEEFENKPRKQQGYSTVSHFNVVHYDCHTAAVRAARGREEWESAMLQNANTKCNGLLPLWGPHVPESAFATCLARHNTYLQEATGHKEPNVTSTVHDLKLLLLRFAYERSFSEETGGGGPQSNVHLIPYMVHMAQYVINTTRSSAREERAVSAFLDQPPEKWTESSYDVDGPLFIAAMSVFVCDGTRWASSRIHFLKRLLVLSQARQASSSPISKVADKEVKSYDTYKPFLLFWAMIDLIYNELLKQVPKVESSETWASTSANYIRHNDAGLLDTSEKMMTKFQQEFLPSASLEEFVDVAGLHDDLGKDMQTFMKELFQSLPN